LLEKAAVFRDLKVGAAHVIEGEADEQAAEVRRAVQVLGALCQQRQQLL